MNNSVRFHHKCTYVFVYCARYSCQILINFSAEFRKIVRYQISCKSVWWEPICSMRTDRQTEGQAYTQREMTKPIVAFRTFAKAPTNVSQKHPSSESATCNCDVRDDITWGSRKI